MKPFRDFRNLAAALFLTGFVALSASARETPPNIILIISDDQGFEDYGFMGKEIVRTPNLDRMAEESLLYTRGYVMPVCSPSLGCLLTGQLPHVHGITGNDLGEAAIEEVHAKGKMDRSPLGHQLLGNRVILPKALTDAGYLTFQTGKLWNVTAKEVGFTEGMTDREGRHGGPGLSIGRESMRPIFDFIKDAGSQEKPFFIWYAPLLPHQPHNPPEELVKHYEGKGLSKNAVKYYAMVEWLDQTCGQLDEFLDENQLKDNTVIIYLADNGWNRDQEAGKTEKGRRGKLSPYELGIRTPIFVRWPGTVEPHRDDETLASIIDIVPTLLSVAGLPVPSALPGIDLRDRQAMTARDTIFIENYTHDIAELGKPEKSLVTQVVIHGWDKLLLPGSRQPDKAYTTAPEEVELYDLRQDPLEGRNLAKEHPELVERLKALQAAEWNTAN